MNIQRAIGMWPLTMGLLSLLLGGLSNTKPYFLSLIVSGILAVFLAGVWCIEHRLRIALWSILSWLATALVITDYAGEAVIPAIPLNVSTFMLIVGVMITFNPPQKSHLDPYDLSEPHK